MFFCFFVQFEAENDALSVMNPYIQDAFKKSGKTGVCTSCTVGLMGILLLLTNKYSGTSINDHFQRATTRIENNVPERTATLRISRS